MKRLLLLALSLILVAACGAPQPTYVRGSDVIGLDDAAMGTGLDRRDLEQLLDENLVHFTQSAFYSEVGQRIGQRPTVAILPMENWTTEHIEPQLHALLGMMETFLVNSGRFTVVSASLRDEILAELRLQQGVAFDPSRAVQVGRQLGVHYFLTGRVIDNTERTATARRVQYFMFMQAIDVETGAITWQNQAELTKAIIPL